jgi:hypothetical protein
VTEFKQTCLKNEYYTDEKKAVFSKRLLLLDNFFEAYLTEMGRFGTLYKLGVPQRRLLKKRRLESCGNSKPGSRIAAESEPISA